MTNQPAQGNTSLRDGIIFAVITGLFVIAAALIQRGDRPISTPVPSSLPVTQVSTDTPATQTPEPTMTPVPTLRVIENFRVSSTNERGSIFTIPETGWYLFEYDRGAFAAWNIGAATTCKPECFSGNLLAFLDRQPTFRSDGGINDGGALFAWYTQGSPGSMNRGSKAEVEKEFAGRRSGTHLRKGQQVYFIVGDGRGAFYDNSGDIYLNISYRP